METIWLGQASSADVHGCSDELCELLDLLPLRPGKPLHFLGDLVDRGPNSVRVIDLMREFLEARRSGAIPYDYIREPSTSFQ